MMGESVRRPKLMVPGPVDVDPAVLAEMGAPVALHYGPEWTALYKSTTSLLKTVFRTEGDVFLLPSSGSGGLEAAIASLFAPGQRILVGVNGFFGERLAAIARSHGVEVVTVDAPWGTPIAPEAVRAAAQTHARIAGLVVAHHETSTGVLNPVAALGALAKEYDFPLVVDAVSSLGGEEFAMDDWGVSICVTASQKCLAAPPGLALVAVARHAWAIIDRRDDSSAGWYLNLKVWRRYAEEWGGWHPFPVTVPTSSILALRVALDLLLSEGVARRIDRHRETAHFLRAGLRDLGFRLYVDGEAASSTVTVARRLAGMEVADVITLLLEERGIIIAGGLGPTRGEVFRVGHMGLANSRDYASLLLAGLADYVRSRRLQGPHLTAPDATPSTSSS